MTHGGFVLSVKGLHCRTCAAFDSALGKEKIKMKKEVVKNNALKRNTFKCICIILHKCNKSVIEI